MPNPCSELCKQDVLKHVEVVVTRPWDLLVCNFQSRLGDNSVESLIVVEDLGSFVSIPRFEILLEILNVKLPVVWMGQLYAKVLYLNKRYGDERIRKDWMVLILHKFIECTPHTGILIGCVKHFNFHGFVYIFKNEVLLFKLEGKLEFKVLCRI